MHTEGNLLFLDWIRGPICWWDLRCITPYWMVATESTNQCTVQGHLGASVLLLDIF
mgnify:CR=1 FL=1